MATGRFLAASLAAAASLASFAGDGELVSIGFEETVGGYSYDERSGTSAVLAPSAKWAKGMFGGALVTGETSSWADVSGIKGVDGADAATVFLRFRKNGPGTGKYPCLLSSHGWTGKGGLLFYSDGRRITVRMRDGEKKAECAMTAFPTVPEKKWSSVAVVWSRPDVRVYAGGKCVAERKWDHRFLLGAVRIGGWSGCSFGGFTDDFKVYSRALAADEISALAGDTRYAEMEGYQDDGTGGIGKTEILGQKASPLCTLESDDSSFVFDAAGCISSIKEKKSGRELSATAHPFVSFEDSAGMYVPPIGFSKTGDGLFRWVFPRKAGEVICSVESFGGGWMFTVKKCTIRDFKVIKFGTVKPVCEKWRGSFANAWSDERSAVCLRSCDLKGDPESNRGTLCVKILPPFNPEGHRFALSAGPREGFLEQLKKMTVAAGVPRSDCGGAWAMGSEPSRWSYVFAHVKDGDIGDWIEFVKRSGFSLIHLGSSWASLLGPYPVNERAFPGGLDGMAAACAKVRGAGLRAGMHTLTACINPRAKWISPVCDTNLVAVATYTLAAPLKPADREITVNEMPVPVHSTVFTYSSAGNAMRLGNEIIQYTGIRREKPYAFTGITRGAFGTRRNAGTVPAGTPIDYLRQRYIAFYPKPDSPLADKLADRLAEVYNTCGLDEFYFDGSEGMGTRYGIDAMRHKIYSRLKANNGHSPIIEASCPGANNWWFQTRTATTDHGVYGVKRFHDWHVRWAVHQGRKCNFLEPQMGWWQPRTDVPRARGHFLDEMEYFAAKNAGHDAAMSIQGVTARPLPVGVRRQMTVLGWYEYPRLGYAFSPEAKKLLAAEGVETRLRQNAKGVWEMSETGCHVHRAASPELRKWKVESAENLPASLRVEALYTVGPEETSVMLLGADSFPKMVRRNASGTESSFETVSEASPHGKTFRLSAKNVSADRKGAWAMAERRFDFPGVDVGKERIAFGVWVKGDGSGALLNLCLHSPKEYVGGVSEHHVRLDFKGWRHVKMLLRERDAALHGLYDWPFGGGYAAVYRNFVNTKHIGTFSAYLNDIPAGGKACVEIGEVKAYESPSIPLENAVVKVNGTGFAVPFAMKSGEYAELASGSWTHYSAMGDKLAVAKAESSPRLVKGANEISLEAGNDARAEVTVFTHGAAFPAFVPRLTAGMEKAMRFEGMMPFEYAPAKGFLPPAVIPVRPGRKARLSIEIYGPCSSPCFTFKRWFGIRKDVCAFPAEIAEDEKLTCLDGVNWKVVKCATGKVSKEGVLPVKVPLLKGSTPLDFSARVPDGKVCTVDLLKEYE